MFVTGFVMIVQLAGCNTLLQTIADDPLRGRVMSFYTMALLGAAPFGSLLVGVLADLVGVQVALLLTGLVSLAGAIVFLRRLPALREMVRPIYQRRGIIP